MRGRAKVPAIRPPGNHSGRRMARSMVEGATSAGGVSREHEESGSTGWCSSTAMPCSDNSKLNEEYRSAYDGNRQVVQ
jgi:hypothetical protein